MAILISFAFLSGIITILSPCILPVLPIVLSGGIGGGRGRPFGILAGFVASFTVFTLALSAIVKAIGIPSDALRWAAVVLIVAFGVVMVVPRLSAVFEGFTSRVASLGHRGGPASGAAPARTGFWTGLPVGLSLGLVWTPCVGPIMASVITLALTQRVNGGAVFITLAYTLGTSIPMLAIMLGGRALLARVPALTRNTAKIQRGFGVLMVVVGVAIAAGWDRQFETAVLRIFPHYGSGLTAIETTTPVQKALRARDAPAVTPASAGGSSSAIPASAGGLPAANSPADGAPHFAAQVRTLNGAADTPPQNGVLQDYGLAPRIVTHGMWFNTAGIAPASASAPPGGSPPLTMADLRGKVVLVDFWTYSCINCVRTIPYLQRWYNAYKNDGFVIIGVHTPEFEFEKNPANVAKAIKALGVDWPVVQDNNYAQWNAYANQYWPADYFIDATGHVRYFQFGEGDYGTAEKVILALLKEAGHITPGAVSLPTYTIDSRTPETYLGYGRENGFTPADALMPGKTARYTAVNDPSNGQWSLSGTWTVSSQFISPDSSGTLVLGFNARNVFLVISPLTAGGTVGVTVDGRVSADTPDVKDGILTVGASRLYQVVGLSRPGPHVLRLNVKGNVRLYAFTFG